MTTVKLLRDKEQNRLKWPDLRAGQCFIFKLGSLERNNYSSVPLDNIFIRTSKGYTCFDGETETDEIVNSAIGVMPVEIVDITIREVV
jgi:hypothetical protein